MILLTINYTIHNYLINLHKTYYATILQKKVCGDKNQNLSLSDLDLLTHQRAMRTFYGVP